MKRILKWVFIVVGSVILLLVILGLTLFLRGQSRIDDTFDVSTHTVKAAVADSATLARGKHLATISNCTGCHGEDLAGTTIVDDPAFGVIAAPNLTTGEGGVVGNYNIVDWEKAIRHGVGGDGRMLLVMPSNFYTAFSDGDLASLVSYLQTVPPVDKSVPEKMLGPLAKLLIGSGQYVPPVLSIVHEANHPDAPEAQVTVAYGEYLSQLAHCGDCHGADFAGLDVEGPPPGPDITQAGPLGQWSETDFMIAMRTGTTPDNRGLDPAQMPWQRLATMSDVDIRAIWAFLETK